VGEIAVLREKLQARKYRRMEIATAIDGKVRDIRHALAGYPLDKIADLPLDLVARLAGEAAELQGQYRALNDEIATVERELA
jgi:hypothetical protein